MVVTLEVSKLSGWLKADARCRVEGRAHAHAHAHACDAGGGEVRAGRREGLWCGGGTTRGMHREGPTQGLGAKGTRGERTENMPYVVVTLEVSKLSGWLKADACCRVEGEGTRCGGERCEPGGGRARGGGGTQETCTGKRPVSRLGGQGHARRAHLEHLAHGRDAGGVKAQRLVEGRRALPS